MKGINEESFERQLLEGSNFMKRNIITVAFFAFFLVFSLIVMPAQPVYALKSSDLGISTSKPKRSYNNKNGKYCMEITLKNKGDYIAGVSAYIYNAEGKCVVKWDNNGDSYRVYKGEEKTLKFAVNYSKYPSKSYTFVYQVESPDYDRYFNSKGVNEKPVFTWKWTITSQEVSPYISFKKLTLHTLNDGSVVPRININTKNIKGQSLTMYIYDEYGDLVCKHTGPKRASNNETAWFSWNGKSDGQQFPDGNYTVKVVSSGGLKITKKFYLDFPYNNR